MDEKLLKLMIIQWLKTKLNYIYFSRMNKEDLEESVKTRVGKLLNSAQIHHDNLEAHECYFVKHLDDVNDLTIDHHKPNKRNYTFNNFNIPMNECIYDVEHMYLSSRNMKYFNRDKFAFNVKQFMMQLIHSLRHKNKFIENDKCLKLKYKDIFYDKNDTESAVDMSRIFNKILWHKKDKKDFLLTYIAESKKLTDKIIEVGLFYPFKLYSDIFQDKHYLVEVNPIKFKNMEQYLIYKHVAKFFREYEMNYVNGSRSLTIEKYFMMGNASYENIDMQNLQYAYFDPLKFLNKYNNELLALMKYIQNKNIDIHFFMQELLYFFNYVQLHTVVEQQSNLIRKIILRRSKNRQFSFNEFVKKIKTIMKNEISNEILEEMKEYYTFISMEEMINTYQQKANSVLIEKYSLDKTSYKFINSAIIDLVFFYNNPKKENIANYFNNTLNNIFLNNQNNTAKKTIKDNAEKDFIQRYRNEFNVIHPYKAKKSFFTTTQTKR